MKGERTASAATDSPRIRAIDFRDAFLDSVTPEDVSAIVKTLLELAKAGDIRAASLLLNRVVGVEPVTGWDDRDSATRRAIMLDSF